MRETHKLPPSPSKWPALARSHTSIEPYIISAPADRLEREPNQLTAYLRLTRKYKWVFITNALLCGLAAFVITRFEPAEYAANAQRGGDRGGTKTVRCESSSRLAPHQDYIHIRAARTSCQVCQPVDT